MTDILNEIMDFNPQDLNVFTEPQKQNFNDSIYKCNPKDSISEDGHYRSRIRVLYNPFNVKQSIVQQCKYAMRDINGFFMVNSKLANGDRSCPIFSSWKKLWFSGDENKKEWARKMYDKSESQWVLVQVLEDQNKPELVGQIKVMKLPKAIFNKMVAKMNPSQESKKQPIPIMDYLIGLPLEMDVVPGPDDPKSPERKNREISYDLSDFDTEYAPIIKIDGTPLFEDSELELIDSYVNNRNEFFKAKTEAKKQAAQKRIEEDSSKVKELYNKAMEYLKENALNLEDECGYKEWNEELKSRVNNWIELVADMKDPSTTINTSQPVTSSEPKSEASTNAQSVDIFSGVNDDNDLPF